MCDTDAQAPERLRTQGVRTICVDEKTGMRAVERSAETLPMRPGRVERREHEYVRHGTQCLTANFEVATGRVIAPTVEATRTEADFAGPVARAVATDPDAGWVLVADNSTTHCSATLVVLVATLVAIPVGTLGAKGESGVLKSVASRRAFLTDPGRRIRFVFTSKHTSWLNQVEIWFGGLAGGPLRRGNFRSVADLRAQVLNFVAYHNRLRAKPHQWAYTGRPKAT